jgi:hypothetical protein
VFLTTYLQYHYRQVISTFCTENIPKHWRQNKQLPLKSSNDIYIRNYALVSKTYLRVQYNTWRKYRLLASTDITSWHY